MNEKQAKDVLKKAIRLSPARMTEVSVTHQTRMLSRFANSYATQSLAEENLEIAIRVIQKKRMGRAVTNRFTEKALADCCDRALKLARNAASDENILPLPGPQNYLGTNAFFESTANASPEQCSEIIGRVFERGKDASCIFAGQNEVTVLRRAIANSQGLFAFAQATNAVLNIIAAAKDGRTSFSSRNTPDIEKLSPETQAEQAITKLNATQRNQQISPGEYVVILEPQAVLTLLSLLVVDYISQISHFSGTAVNNGEGIVAGRTGERVFGGNFTLDDDVFHPLLQGIPFDGEGMPTIPIIMIFQGILTHLLHSRASALQMSEEPTGHGLALPNSYGAVPRNLVMQGGESSVEEMIKATERGVYVSRFWYTRLVDPGKLAVTGLTRDGTFLVEKGEIVGRLGELRFNENLYNVFSNITHLGRAERTWDIESRQLMVVPPIRVEGFRFGGSTNG